MVREKRSSGFLPPKVSVSALSAVLIATPGSRQRAFSRTVLWGEFEWMRQVRNATEYPDDDRPTATKQDVAEAITAAARIVEVCGDYVRGD
jgi:hypothetical protein